MRCYVSIGAAQESQLNIQICRYQRSGADIRGHVGAGIVGATLIPACPTCMQQPLEKNLLVYKRFPPPPHLLNILCILYFMGISLLLV